MAGCVQNTRPEMLWEASDPDEVLARRFGHTGVEGAAAWLRRAVSEHWGIRLGQVSRLVMSDANALAFVDSDGGPLVAKWCVDPARFHARRVQAGLVARLDGQGLPVSVQLPATSGARQVVVDGTSLGLQHQVAGELLVVSDLDAVHEVGAALARLHLALGQAPSDGLGPAPAPLGGRIAGWFEESRPPEQLVATVRSRLAALPEPRHRPQPVHGDVRAANILVQDGRVAAFLDFEQARLDEPLVELARTEVLLATRFRDWRPTTAGARAALRAGYEAVCPLDVRESAWHDVVLAWQAMAVATTQPHPSWWELARRVSG